MQGIDLSHKYKSISEWRWSETLAQKQQKICLKDEIQGKFQNTALPPRNPHAPCRAGRLESRMGIAWWPYALSVLMMALLFSALLYDTSVPITAMPDLISHSKP